jgi:peptide/nickel transport system substrate-binding protein
MIQIHLDHGPFFFGVVSNVPRIGMVKNYFKNVPCREDLELGGFAGPWIMVYPGIINPPKFYIDK